MADQPSARRADFGPLYLPNLIAALVASVGLVIGSLGPWATLFGVSRGGMAVNTSDAVFTLIMGIAASAALFGVLNLGLVGGKTKLMKRLSIGAVTAGVLGAIGGITNILEISTRSTKVYGETVRPEVAWGVWLVLISSAALVATATIVARQVRKKSDVD